MLIFQEYAMSLSVFLILNKHSEKNILRLFYPRFQESFNGENHLREL